MRPLSIILLSVVLGSLGVITPILGQPSATFSGNIVAPSSGGPVACDVGPNAPAVPTPANDIGFTACALNADFTNAAFFPASKNWLNGCGGGTGGVWEIVWGTAFGAGTTNCARIDIENDPSISKNVLHIQFQPGDITPSSLGGNVQWSLSFPNLGAGSTMLPQAWYVEMLFRFSPTGLQGGIPAGPMDFWQNGAGGGPSHYVEVDFFEQASGIPGRGVGGLLQWSNGSNPGSSNSGEVIDLHNYSGYLKYQVLHTNDGTLIFQECFWANDAPLNATGGGAGGGVNNNCIELGWNAGTAGCNATCLANEVFADVHKFFLDLWVGPGNVSSIPNAIDMYIQNIRIFACPGYRNLGTTCQGTLHP